VLHRPIGESWFGFTAVRAIPEVDPEVLLIPLTGHSVGHCGVAVSTDDGWLLHAGDAYFHHAEIAPRGKVPIGIRAYQQVYQANRRRRLENQARLRDLHARRSDTIRIICSHDPVYFDRLSARARWREMAEAGRVAVGAR
jgi:glyoxylase-like metal-dependent hydrolase (beta-lactamase superfamily II)